VVHLDRESQHTITSWQQENKAWNVILQKGMGSTAWLHRLQARVLQGIVDTAQPGLWLCRGVSSAHPLACSLSISRYIYIDFHPLFMHNRGCHSLRFLLLDFPISFQTWPCSILNPKSCLQNTCPCLRVFKSRNKITSIFGTKSSHVLCHPLFQLVRSMLWSCAMRSTHYSSSSQAIDHPCLKRSYT
jgi:hypothetical protein